MSYKVYVQRVLDNYDPMDGKAVEEQRAPIGARVTAAGDAVKSFSL